MKYTLLSLLLTLVLSVSTVATTEDTLEDAIDIYDTSQGNIAVILMDYYDSPDEHKIQNYELEIGTGLDELQSLVVQSCYDDWYGTVITVYHMLIIGRELGRYGMAESAATVVRALDGLRILEQKHRFEAMIACGEV